MEGPSVHIVADELSVLENQEISNVQGNAAQPLSELPGQPIESVRAVKKRLFIDCDTYHIVTHFLMYGSYRLNASRDLDERLSLVCSEDTLNIYSCSVKVLEADSAELSEYDRPWEDVLSADFDREQALAALENRADVISDVLLDQDVFGGVGNIIKNEVLWLTGIHPEAKASAMDAPSRDALVSEVVEWTHDWYNCKKEEASPGLQVYQIEQCSQCGSDIRKENVGKTNRPTYWCPECQA